MTYPKFIQQRRPAKRGDPVRKPKAPNQLGRDPGRCRRRGFYQESTGTGRRGLREVSAFVGLEATMIHVEQVETRVVQLLLYMHDYQRSNSWKDANTTYQAPGVYSGKHPFHACSLKQRCHSTPQSPFHNFTCAVTIRKITRGRGIFSFFCFYDLAHNREVWTTRGTIEAKSVMLRTRLRTS